MDKVKLGDIAELKTGPFGTQFSASEYVSDGIPMINVKDIGYGEIYTDALEMVSESTKERLAQHVVNEDDIVFGRKGSIDRHAYIGVDQDGWMQGSDCIRVRVNPNINARWLSHFFKLSYVRNQVLKGGVGSTMPSLNTDILKDVDILLPSRNVQDAVEYVLSCIDDKIANNKKLMAELEDTARLIHDYWFTQFDFPDENGNPYRSSGGKMVWSNELKREIPSSWTVGSLATLGEIISGATPSTTVASNYAEAGIAWITPNDLSDSGGRMHIGHGERDISEQGLRTCSAQLMPQGSVIMSSRAPIGYLAVAKEQCCTNQGCKSLVPKNGYGSYFIYFTIKRRMPIIKAQGVGTTFSEVSKETLASIPLEEAPVSIAERFEDVVFPLCTRIKSLEKECDELASLRDWLLPMLMNGQATITE